MLELAQAVKGKKQHPQTARESFVGWVTGQNAAKAQRQKAPAQHALAEAHAAAAKSQAIDRGQNDLDRLLLQKVELENQMRIKELDLRKIKYELDYLEQQLVSVARQVEHVNKQQSKTRPMIGPVLPESD